MDYSNGAYLYIMGAAVAVFVLAQSVVFLIRAVRQGRRIGLSAKVMKDAAVSSATFSVVPSIPIVIAMIALAATLGAPFSWIRLSVIGSMSYETMAAGAVAGAANIDSGINVFASAMWVMTLGIISGPLFNIFGLKKYQSKIEDIGKRDPKWSKILIDALFMGIIAVMGGQFISKGVAAFGGFASEEIIKNGEAQLLTLVSSALIMAVFGFVIGKTKAKWLENFALPISMIGAIALSVVYHGMFLGGA
ncbi:MAG: DUF5058 family protein [Eubacteriales bacterium]|nr:DUF5058 family protein [Eubacteriales bacterium]